MDAHLMAALAEPNRLRIVELLDAAPRAVGEIAGALELRQPQVTKHLQTLERAGLVEMHPLGQRRIYALRREPLRELRGWLGRFDTAHPSEDVLVDYRAALEAERARGPQTDRELRIERTLAAPPPEVWRAWTSADAVGRWWAPRHFTVADCDVEPVPGGRLSIVMAESDGTRHRAEGRFLDLTPPSGLRFELAPLGPDGAPLFSATHELRLEPRRGRTRLTMTIRVSGESAAAGPALAGMRIGWGQSLDKLEAALGGG